MLQHRFPNSVLHILFCCCLLLSTSTVVCAANLKVTLNDTLPPAIKSNILSHLGTLPNNELERSAFIYSAKDNINKALQALGYYQADIIINVNKATWLLNIQVKLNAPTLLNQVTIAVQGEAVNDPAFIKLLNQHDIKPGKVLHQGHYEQLKSALLSLALQRGYFDGQLTENKIVIQDDFKQADITLLYYSGHRYRFGDISFNEFALDNALLKGVIPFKENTYYSTEHFHQLQQQLQATQYFSSVALKPLSKITDHTNERYQLPVEVTLTPAKSHQFDFGIGFSTDTQFRLSAAWRTPLINVYGHFQETKIEYSKENSTGRFIYSIPWHHPTNDILQLSISVENEDYADFKTKYYSTKIGRAINQNNWQRQIYTRFHQEAWQYEFDTTDPNFTWDDLDTANYIIPGITWSRTIRTGSPLDPSSGFRQTYNIEGAHLSAGSDNSFFRVHGRWQLIHTLADKHRLVTRAELGAIYVDRDVELAPSLRFYAGGDQSIRGFGYQTIGSTIPSSSDPDKAQDIVVGSTRLAVASIEYQYYLNEKWRMAFFSDGGNVANKGEFEPVYSFGSGLHYLSPVGAIKVDVAYGIDDDDKAWRIHISLGAEL